MRTLKSSASNFSRLGQVIVGFQVQFGTGPPSRFKVDCKVD